MLNIRGIKEPNLTENHHQVPTNEQQAPTVNASDACAQKKGTSQSGFARTKNGPEMSESIQAAPANPPRKRPVERRALLRLA